MTPDQRFLGMMSIISGRVFLIGVFAASLWTNHSWGWKLALAAEGCSYTCATLQAMEMRGPAVGAFTAAFAIGLFAFLSILV
jgi:hypothetical protein